MLQRNPDDPQLPDKRRGAMVGLIIVLALLGGGLYLVHVIRGMSNIQDCVMSGRTNCAPISSSQ